MLDVGKIKDEGHLLPHISPLHNENVLLIFHESSGISQRCFYILANVQIKYFFLILQFNKL